MHAPLIGRWLAPLVLALAIALAPPSGPPITLASPFAALPTDSSAAWFDVEQPPTAPFESVQMVVDFPPGARVGRHTHGGPGYITMLAGIMTMSIGDAPVRAYGPNESFVEPFKLVAEGANLHAEQASLLVTYLLPVGAPITTLVQTDPADRSASVPAAAGQLPPGAVPRFESRLRLDSMPAGYRVGQMLQTYAPGDWSASAMTTAPRLLTVLSGEVHVLSGADDLTYTAGQAWTETPGTAYLIGNQGTSPAVVAVSVLEPRR